jgi:hypothetical protein
VKRCVWSQNDVILLMHFSARYSGSDILAMLDKELPDDIRRRIVPFLQGFSLN